MGSITNGTITSFGNTPQAQDDLIYATTTKLAEDSTAAVYLDVMANDLAGNAKILYSLDDGASAGGIRPTDLLTQDLGRIESASSDFSAHGAHIWITSDGKVGYDPSTWQPTFKAQLDALGAGQYLTDTFTYAIRMANGALSWATATVQIAGKNDAPVIDLDQNDSSGATGSGYHASFTENGTAVAVADLDVTITDVDSANLASATVTLTNAKAGDSLAVLGALPAGITAVVDSSVPGVIKVTLTGSASLAGYQTALKQVVFSNSSDDPDTTQRNVTVVVNDGTADSNTASAKIDVVAVNDAPALDLDANNSSASGTGFAATFTENGAALSIADLDLTITDPDDANIESATIKLLNAKADDSLNIGALPAGILGAVDTSVPGVITVTLTGSASLADYQAALKLVTFSNSSENPDTTPRDVSVVVNDGDADSNVAHATITVIAVNDAPTSTNDSVTTDEDTAVILGVGDFGAYSDVEGDSFAAVKITALPTNGSLEFLSGVTWVAVTIGQEISEADLSGGKLRFVPDLNENGSAYASIGFRVGDGTDFSADSYVLTLDVTAVNDAPVNTVPGAQSVDEDTALAFTGLNTISVSDVDVGETLGGKIEVSLSVEHGSLALGTTTGLSGDLAGSDGTLKFQGTLADVNAALASLGYQGDLNFNGSDTLKIDTSDLGNTGSGGIKIDSDTVAITVTSVNDAPAGADATVTTDEDTAYTFQIGDFGFSDPADGDSLLAVKIATLPLAGTLLLDGSPVSVDDFVSAADIAAGKLTFEPAANANGAGYAGFTFQVQDDGGTLNGGVDLDQSPNTITIDVTSVNDAPAGADKTVTTDEDTAYAFTTADFGFTDPADGNSLLAVKISTLPVSGSLLLDGSLVSPDDFISAADIAAGKLTFAPAADANGAGYAGFTFQAQDDGGTLNGGVDLDQSPNILTINVNAVNDAPQGTDNTIATNEDTAYVFQTSDFGFSDPVEGDGLLAVKISTLPLAGTLLLDGSPVSADDFVSAADITAGKLTFAPAANANGAGYAGFTFQVQDDGGTASGGVDLDPVANTIAIDVTSVNDAPAGADKTVTMLEDGVKTFAVADFGFSDVNDSPADNFAGIVVSVLPGAGVLKLDGVSVSASDFISAADITAGKLTFAPAADANGAGYASFTFQVRDDGGIASGGQNTDASPNTITIDVTAVNDAPVNTVPGAQSVNEDTALAFTGPNAISVSDVDVGGGKLEVSLAVDNGSLALTTMTGLTFGDSDGSDGTLKFQGTQADVDAALASLSYKGDLNFNGSDTLTILTNDLGNTGVDPGLTDGPGAEQDKDTIAITVNAVNDAPASTDDSVTTNEDTTVILGLSDFGTYFDVEGTPIAAVKITTLESDGSLEYFNGAIWVAVTPDQVISAADISGGKLRFVSDANENGSPYATVGFKVSDGTDFSAAAYTLTVNVAAINDAPAGADKTVTMLEDGVKAFAAADFGFSDVNDSPASNFAGIVVSALPGAGVLKLDGVPVSASDFISASDIAAGKLTFAPAADANGAGYASFTFQVRDDGGTASGGQNTDASPNSITIDVTPVNDAPVVDLNGGGAGNDAIASFTEQTPVIIAPSATIVDIDSANLTSLTATLTARPDGNAVESLLLNAAATAAAAGLSVVYTAATGVLSITGSASKATYQTILDGIQYNNTSDAPTTASRTVDVVVSDGVDSSVVHGVTIGVTPVNDAPVNTVPGAQSVSQATATAISGISVADVDLGSSQIKITLSDAHGNLSLGTTTGLVFSDPQGDHQMVFTGTLADVNAALATLTYTGDAGYTGGDTITLKSDDQGATGSGGALIDTDTIALTVNAINHAPTAQNDQWILSNLPASLDIQPLWLLGNDIDADADTLVITKINGIAVTEGAIVASDFTAHVSAGVLTSLTYDGTPTGTSTSFTYSVSDGHGGTSTATVNVAYVTTDSGANGINLETDAGIPTDYNYSYVDALSGNDTITGGVTLSGTAGVDTFLGNNGKDTLTGNFGDDFLFGNENDDKLFGGAGNDALDGGNNDDVLQGGAGDDTLTGGTGRDTFQYLTLAEGTDSVTDFDISSGGDTLDISAVLDLGGNTWVDGSSIGTAVAGGYLTFTDNGGHVQVNIDIDGTAGGSAPAALAVLTNVAWVSAAQTQTDLADNIVLG